MKKLKLITTKATALSIAAILAVTGSQPVEVKRHQRAVPKSKHLWTLKIIRLNLRFSRELFEQQL